MLPTPHASLPPEEIPPGGKEYRVTRTYLVISVLGLIFFTAMGTYSFYSAWTNADNSFPNPEGDAIVFGGFWIIPALVSIWLIFSSLRSRLLIGADGVRIKGVFRTREVRFSDVNRAVWKTLGSAGKLALYDSSGKATVEFGNYAPYQKELMQYFGHALAGRDQEDWEDFAETYNVNLRPMRAAPREPKQAPADAGRMEPEQFTHDQSAAPLMTRAEYEVLAERTRKSMRRGQIAVLLVSLAMVMAISFFISPRYHPELKQQIAALYQHFPGVPHAVIGGVGYLIILGAAVGGPTLFSLYAYRFGGLRCPRCHRNMTYRRKTAVVLRRGECPFCHAKLFKEDGQ